jgi:hypothetical protein
MAETLSLATTVLLDGIWIAWILLSLFLHDGERTTPIPPGGVHFTSRMILLPEIAKNLLLQASLGECLAFADQNMPFLTMLA